MRGGEPEDSPPTPSADGFPTPSPGLLVEQFFYSEQIGKRKFIRIVESKIPKIAVLSILKKRL